MKLLLVAAASLAVVNCASSLSMEDQEFHEWKLKFGKVYRSPEEESRRKDIWLSTRHTLLAHNILADQGIKTYRMGMNHFSDMDELEFKTLYGGLLPKDSNRESECDEMESSPLNDTALPKYVDWNAEGCVTPVKDQDKCGSCWAFASVGALESHTCIKGKEKHPTELSEQQLVDCAWSYGNKGCHGGLMAGAFKYCMDTGIVTEDIYQYAAKAFPCPFTKSNPIPDDAIGARCSGCRHVPGDERSLQRAVAEEGPVTIGIPVHPSFMAYESGVYHEPDCITKPPLGHHALLVVGYGTSNAGEYWLVKNSWGESWGERGYIRMARNEDNNCDIASHADYPVVDLKGGSH